MALSVAAASLTTKQQHRIIEWLELKRTLKIINPSQHPIAFAICLGFCDFSTFHPGLRCVKRAAREGRLTAMAALLALVGVGQGLALLPGRAALRFERWLCHHVSSCLLLCPFSHF